MVPMTFKAYQLFINYLERDVNWNLQGLRGGGKGDRLKKILPQRHKDHKEAQRKTILMPWLGQGISRDLLS
jgi:hypothetical protein